MAERAPLLLLLLLAALLAGFLLRSSPGLDEKRPFDMDPAYHLRMTEAKATGTIAVRDSLRLHPLGARIVDTQPTGLYAVTAALRGISPAASLDVTARWTTALFGALVAIPVFLVSRRLYASAWAGALAALVIAVLPAHVLRTLSSTYRFDALATLLVGLHLHAVVVSLSNARARWVGPLAAGASLFCVLAIWRAGLALFALEALALPALLLVENGRRRVASTALGLAAGFLAGGFLPYVSGQEALVSRIGVMGLLACALSAALGASPLAARRMRDAAVAGTFAIIALAGLALPASRFDRDEGSAIAAIAARLGLAESDPYLATLYRLVTELRPHGLGAFVHPEVFAWCTPLALCGVVAVFAARMRADPAAARFRRMRPEVLFALAWGAAWIAATMLIDRSKALGAIGFAIACGGAVRLSAPGWRRWAVATGAAALLVPTVLTSARLAGAERHADFAALDRAIAWLGHNVPPGAGVLSGWSDGYAIQTYARRPTFTDGYLEHPLNRARIEAVDRALVSPVPDSLLSLMAANDLSWILIHARTVAMPFLRLGISTLEGIGFSLPPEADRSVAFRLARGDPTTPLLKERFSDPPFHVFAFVREDFPRAREIAALADSAARARAEGDMDLAIRLYTRLADARPGDVGPVLQLGYCLLGSDAIARAVDVYEEALRRDPTSAAAANGLAWTLVETGGDAERAVRLARAAVSREPNAYHLDTLARAHLAAGRCPEAREAGRRALEAALDDPAFAGLLEEIERRCE